MHQYRTQQPNRQGSAASWFIILIAIAGLFAAIVLFPDQIRSVIPTSVSVDPSPAPPVHVSQPRSNPEVQSDVHIEPAPLTLGFERTQDAGSRSDKGPERPQVVQEKRPSNNNEQAGALLGKARKAYVAFDWQLAKEQARRVTQLDNIDARFTRRAQIIIDTSPRLEDMFKRLNERDELQRNFSAHPSQVTVRYRGREMAVIPVLDMRSKVVPETDDPLRWMQGELENRGEVAVLMASNGTGTTLEQKYVGGLQATNIDSQVSQLQSGFDQRLQRLKQGDLKADPLAWYAAARHAYQNRLDERVTELLERAIYLNPRLTQAIRNDKAHDIYLKMVDQLSKGNRAAAANWKVQLDKYQDSVIYEEALAYYKGNLDELRQARKDAVAKAKAEAAEIRKARIERAENTGDTAAIAQIKEEPATIELVDEGPTQPVSGDVAKANDLMDQGLAIYRAAQAMGAVPERDVKYKDAGEFFTAARDIYFAQGMEAEGIRANQLRYACIKYRRF